MTFIDPAMDAIATRMRAASPVDYRAMPIDEARIVFEKLAAPWNEGRADVAEVIDCSLLGWGSPMRARLYRPSSGVLPVILFVHGGGWTFGSIDSHDGVMRKLALDSGCAVYGFNYRRAPGHQFPKRMDDVLIALSTIQAGGLGPDIDKNRIALAGDSAGANLALAALLTRRDRREPMPRTAALFYGCYEPTPNSESHRLLGDGSWFFSTAINDWYWRNFLGASYDAPNPIAAPLRANLEGLPPLYLNAAGLDPLCDDTTALSKNLTRAGVRHRFDYWPGVVHGFLRMQRDLPAARDALKAAGAFIRAELA